MTKGIDTRSQELRLLQCSQDVGKLKWKRVLELAFDAVVEAESGDLGLIARNLVEAATAMLVVASEIQGRLRQ